MFMKPNNDIDIYYNEKGDFVSISFNGPKAETQMNLSFAVMPGTAEVLRCLAHDIEHGRYMCSNCECCFADPIPHTLEMPAHENPGVIVQVCPHCHSDNWEDRWEGKANVV